MPVMSKTPAQRIGLGFLLALIMAARASGQAMEVAARQVTLFGVIATPADLRVDPKLAKVAPQLRKLLPNHGFRLLDVQSKRLTAGETLSCTLESGYVAETTLIEPLDGNGKVQLRCAVLRNQAVQLETKVATPANQLFFCDKVLNNGSRLLIGIGAR